METRDSVPSQHVYGRDIEGAGEGLVCRDGSVELEVIVLGRESVDVYRYIRQQCPGEYASFLKKGAVEQGLEDAACAARSLQDVDLAPGPAGSKVKLTLSRKDKNGDYQTIPDITLKRAKIVPEVVYYRMLPDQVGYLYMVDFSGHSTEEVKKALADLQKQGMTSLVLDLRFNPGGLLTGAVTDMRLK